MTARAELEPANRCDRAREERPERDARRHAERDPEREKALEGSHGPPQAAGFVALTNALMNFPSTWGASASASIPAAERKSRASLTS